MSRISLLGLHVCCRVCSIVLFALFLTPSQVHAGTSAFATSTTLSVVPGTSVTQGTMLTLQAAIDDGEGAVTVGSVTFYDGARVLAAVRVVSGGSTYTPGTANFQLFLGPGSHSLKAAYAGTATFSPSTSSTTTVTVAAPSSAVTSTAISSTGSAGSYTLNGKVTAFSATAATGNVSFSDQTNGNFALGTSALDPATLTSGWQTFAPFATPNASYAIIMGDLNADGISDLVTSNYTGTTISVFLGNGDGTFQAHTDRFRLQTPSW